MGGYRGVPAMRRDIRRVIVGLQGSGKTVLAKHLIAQYRKVGVSTLVIDYQHEYNGKNHTAYRITDRVNPTVEVDNVLQKLIIDPYEDKIPLKRRYGHLILDETPRYFALHKPLPPAMGRINDVGRHIGIATTSIGRRFSQMHTDLVELAHEVYIFRQSGINDLRRANDMRAGLADIVGNLAPHHYVKLDMTTGDITVKKPVKM